jgi:hypothetical protein
MEHRAANWRDDVTRPIRLTATLLALLAAGCVTAPEQPHILCLMACGITPDPDRDPPAPAPLPAPAPADKPVAPDDRPPA